MGRRPGLRTQRGTVEGDGGGVRTHGSLDANIIIANAPDPVFVSDLEGKILQANDAVSELLGFRQDELLDQKIVGFGRREETGALRAALREMIERDACR